MKRKCDVCNKPFTKKEWEDRHDYHEPDCTRERVRSIELLSGAPVTVWKNEWVGECHCDLVAHARCCPQCAKA
jgi:hypothetical protein